MSVKLRRYRNGGWEADIRVRFPNGMRHRERCKAPSSAVSAARRWAEARERELLLTGRPPADRREVKKIPTLAEFAERFLDGYARANQQKPSGIAAKETVFRIHLIRHLGERRLDEITTEEIQHLKGALAGRAPKTVNNVLTVLNVALKCAVAWGVIERMPCAIRLLPVSGGRTRFYDFDEFEKLVESARLEGTESELVVLLGGEAGLRCGEMMALDWRDVDLSQPQLTVSQSTWKGHTTTPKGGRIRHVPLTSRLAAALTRARPKRAGRVIANESGRPFTQRAIQGLALRAARRAGVEHGVHILRHTFCSHLAMRGAPVRAIQELAGHQNLATTQRYMHLSRTALDSAIRLLERGRGEIVETVSTEVRTTA